MKLRAKIQLLLIPLIVLPLLVLGWIAYVELRGASEQRVFGEMQAAIDHLAAHVEIQVQTATANIELFAKHTLIKKYILTEDEEERYTLLQAPVLRVFRGFQEAFPNYYEIRILLPDGYEDIRRTTGFIENLTEEEGGSPQFQAIREAGEVVHTAVFRNPDNEQVSLLVAKPLILRDPAVDPTGVPPSLRGYLVITAGLQELASHVADDVIGKTGYLVAADNEGRLMFRPEKLAANKSLSPVVFDSLSNHIHTAAPLKTGQAGQSAFVSGRRLLPDLFLFAFLPESELVAISHRLGMVVAAITLLTTLITAFCLYMVLQRMVIRPIHALEAVSKEIGRGNLDCKGAVSSKDELGQLSKAFEDMSENLKCSNEQIHYIAYHDSLTGLPNRAMFREYLSHVIAHARRNDKQFALLFLDLDDFKRINDTLGHHAGDRLLKEVTERLSNHLRDSDYTARMQRIDEPGEILARLGGDEFVILLPEISGPHAPGTLASRLIDALSDPVVIDEHEFFISASIGITLYPVDGEETDELIKNADIAMYHAKEQGKNDYQYYLESMNVLAHERLALESKLRKALENDELCLYYQPQVDAVSGEIVGLEALIRWHHPEDGMISPGLFVPVAEETGLIVPIGEWVVKEACRQNSAWQKAGLPELTVSVNVSGIQFAKHDVPRLVRNALSESRLDPSSLEIEITESVIMSQPDRAVKELSAIRDLGVGIALDDFGTGYSSFSYLHRFPIDTLKIDRSFVRDIGTEKQDAELVAAIIAMAHILKLRVVAEGIETADQLATLVEKRCDIIQGYVFKPPVPAEEIPQLLAKRSLRIA